jgi:hypothetical protein
VTGKDGRSSTKVLSLTVAVRSYTLGGLVRLGFASGDPVPGVAVSIVRPDGSVAGTSTTGADGRFAVSGVPSGNYALKLARDAYRFNPDGLPALQVKQDEAALNFIAHPQHEIVFDEIRSGQFPEANANYLRPGQTVAEAPGAGRVGNAKGILLMATRGEQAVLVAKARLSPPDDFLQQRLVVRCTDADLAAEPLLETAPVWDEPMKREFATFTLGGPWPMLRRLGLTAWIDLNHGEDFDPAIGERRVPAAGTVHVVSMLGYEDARHELGLGANVAASLLNMEQKLKELLGGGAENQDGGLRIAPAFLLAFVDGTAPGLPHAAVVSNLCADGTELDFNVGVPFAANGCGSISEYRFDADSIVGRAVRDSLALRQAALATLALRRDEIARLLRENPAAPTIQVPLVGNQRSADGPGYRDSTLLTFATSDLDLALAFGTAQLDPAQSWLYVDRDAVGMVRVQGAIRDLYDWEYLKHDFDTLAAKVQAGFGSLGDGGEVYRVRAEFSGALFGLPVANELALSADRIVSAAGVELEIRLASTRVGNAVPVPFRTAHGR